MWLLVAVMGFYCFFFLFILLLSQQLLHEGTCRQEYFYINLTNLVQEYPVVYNLSLSQSVISDIITAFCSPALVLQFCSFVFLGSVCVPLRLPVCGNLLDTSL